MPRATKVMKCQNKVFFGSSLKTLFSFFSTLVALRPPTDDNLITLFVGEDGTGNRQGETGGSHFANGRNREPSREGLDFPGTERNWPFAAEDASGMRNDSLWLRNKANMPSSLPSADNASALVSLFRSEALKGDEK